MAASLLDSTLDLLAQVTLAIAAHGATIPDQRYPVGKARLEAAAVVVVSVLFAIGAALVGTHCVERLAEGRDAKVPTLKLDDFVLLTVVVVVKLMLFTVCFHQMRKTKRQGLSQSPVLRALTADHAADVLTNTTALLAALLSSAPRLITHTKPVSTLRRIADPIGGLVISCFVLFGWSFQAWVTVTKLVGRSASDETIKKVKRELEKCRFEIRVVRGQGMESEFTEGTPSPSFTIDTLRVYHGGEKVVVEVEVVMPGDTTLLQSHDVGIRIQKKIESMEFVERAFVHADYTFRDTPEHVDDLKRHVERNGNSGEDSTGSDTASPNQRHRHRRLGSNSNLSVDEDLEGPAFDTVASLPLLQSLMSSVCITTLLKP